MHPLVTPIWLWINTYRYIFSGMNIHLPAIFGFTRYQGFDPSPYDDPVVAFKNGYPQLCVAYTWVTHHLCLIVVEFHHGHHGVVPCFDALAGRDNFNAFANGAAACGQRRLGGGGNGWGRPGMGLERWPVG